MNRVHTIAFRLLTASLVLCSCFAAGTLAQTPSPSPSPEPVKTPESKPANQDGGNPFAPESAPPLPAGMKGSNANDPRAKLSPGMYEAGEAAVGMRHLMLLKKPDVFQLGSDDPDNPKVQKTLDLIGVGEGDGVCARFFTAKHEHKTKEASSSREAITSTRFIISPLKVFPPAWLA